MRFDLLMSSRFVKSIAFEILPSGFTRTIAIASLFLIFASTPPRSQSVPELGNADIKEQARGVLAILGLSVVPSESASAISVNTGNDTEFQAYQIGGAVTPDDAVPIYLEGYFGVARYDPSYLATSGTASATVGAKWTSYAGTAGVGWNAEITEELSLRPIANFSLGHATSDATLIGDAIGGLATTRAAREDLEFLKSGNLNAYGIGGSLLLDWERYREAYELDVEVRYTHLHLQSFGGTSKAVRGSAKAINLGAWTRYRQPIGLTLFDRPVRGVAEASAAWLIGDQSVALGADWIGSAGLGIEAELSAIENSPVSRVRIMGRGVFGVDVSGFSIGLGLTF